ncbi:MAG: RHS domain-containing protein [Veillonella sp.]|uniref:RHS domain-containing protein n=1 Tax=Veillonella sp. TaxID=1926307 RepID=UPI00343BF5AC|nr:RHS domain-containing protein [Veillonella sp.]
MAQVRNWINEDGESRQQTHYFHCDQIGIPREITNKDGNLLWFGNYTGWGRLKKDGGSIGMYINRSDYRNSTSMTKC